MRRYYYKLRTYLLRKKFMRESDLFRIHPKLAFTKNELLARSQVYKGSHEKYIKEISSPEMAMSLELAAFLSLIVEKHKPLNILDLGSGYSTFLFNSIHTHVVSVDDNDQWLKKTETYLIENNIKQYQLLGIEEFRSLNTKFDLIFVDLNFVEERIKFTEKIMSLLNKGGIVIFDDVHKDHYLAGLKDLLNLQNCFLLDTYTKDRFGRFSLLYKNA